MSVALVYNPRNPPRTIPEAISRILAEHVALELLAALEECERHVRSLGKCDEVAEAAAANARAVIAKARGRA